MWRIRKNGERFWADAIRTRMDDAEGNLAGYAKVTRDLTERKRSEETERELLREQAARAAAEASEKKLRESEARYRSLSERLDLILESIEDGVTVQDRTGKVVFSNTAAAAISGFDSRTSGKYTPARNTNSTAQTNRAIFEERRIVEPPDETVGRISALVRADIRPRYYTDESPGE